jgi:RNA polymerase sigma factor (TIGR02999 family)
MPSGQRNTASEQVTALLGELKAGSREAEARLAEVVYPELKRIAARYLQNERRGHTLQPTALVNEVYVRLVGQMERDWTNRCQFYGVAAQLMRWILVDHAKARRASRRGGTRHRVELIEGLAVSEDRLDEVLMVDEALTRLAELHARKGRVVELKFFGGLTEEETAAVLSVDTRTVRRDWNFAKAWLYAEMEKKTQATPPTD